MREAEAVAASVVAMVVSVEMASVLEVLVGVAAMTMAVAMGRARTGVEGKRRVRIRHAINFEQRLDHSQTAQPLDDRVAPPFHG